ncbi:HK97 family phage prohead protease [Sphingomonas carotinifaciens]|uniref:HK97 family phage prohead protease n=1 Tax=Sphingomonas carotinifaciens TaxID=1166323 RepID=UPI000DDC2BF8|nr:HK97 family phage prohead protease [Sphingomonas carotinifaciens]
MSELGFGFEIKSIDEAGYISGIAAGYGNVDHGGDIIMPGALTKAIAGRASVPMLLFHDHKRPVGAWSKFDETDGGLNVEGRIAIKSEAGREAHALVESGALSGLSIGYKTLRHRFEGKTRQLHELSLHEVSLVPVGMNERAVITQVKSIVEAGGMPSVREFEEFLRDAGGFSKSLAAAIATKATPHLRGEPEVKADTELADLLRGLAG